MTVLFDKSTHVNLHENKLFYAYMYQKEREKRCVHVLSVNSHCKK